MSIEALGWVWKQDMTNESASWKLVLLALADSANEDGECWPAYKTLAKKTSLSYDQTRRIVRQLESIALIVRVDRQRDNGSRTSNMFQIGVVPDDHGPYAVAHETAPSSDAPPSADARTPRAPMHGPDPLVDPSVSISEELKEERSAVGQVFAHWQTTMNHPRTPMSDKHRRLIKQGLAVFSPEECMHAITVRAADDWHMKQGKHVARDGSIFDGLEHIFKDLSKTELLVRASASPSSPAFGTKAYEDRDKFYRSAIRAKEQVYRGWEHRDLDHWREQGEAAAEWLRDNGFTVTYDEKNLQQPTIKEFAG